MLNQCLGKLQSEGWWGPCLTTAGLCSIVKGTEDGTSAGMVLVLKTDPDKSVI